VSEQIINKNLAKGILTLEIFGDWNFVFTKVIQLKFFNGKLLKRRNLKWINYELVIAVWKGCEHSIWTSCSIETTRSVVSFSSTSSDDTLMG
jgi:hypothetical protein